MSDDKLFVEADTDTHKVCGCCRQLKPVSEFYKDGLDANGNQKYRRDCRVCYKDARLREAALKGARKGKRNVRQR